MPRYLSSTKKEGLRFKILKGRPQNPEDPGNGNIVLLLEGAHGIKFERTVNDKILQQYGYVVEVIDADGVVSQG